MKRVSLRLLAIMLLGMVVVQGCGDVPEETETGLVAETDSIGRRIIGAKIYETERELQGLFEEWKTLGISTVFVSEELTSAGGFRALAKKNDTDLFIIFPVFYAPKELAENPDRWATTADGERAKEDWVEFACPSRADFRDRRVEEARGIVKRLRPDGLSIDFIRHFVFWEMVGPDRDPATLPDTCYCVHCLQAFATFLGVPPLSIPPQPRRAAVWIETNAADQWVRFKTETITSMAIEIVDAVRAIDPDILINLHIVPWRRDDYDGAITRVAGQDAAALSEIADYLSPMAYSFMLERPPDWVASVVEDLDEVAVCPVLPSIQVSPAYREDEVFSVADFEAALRSALEPPSAGVVFWSWAHIEADSERAAIVGRVVQGR
ncbi:MAG: hypothetical protein OEV48_03215 [Acidobacteriota bacterium]|nr:hypothetical protein [Acidobacteriota bacterium]